MDERCFLFLLIACLTVCSRSREITRGSSRSKERPLSPNLSEKVSDNDLDVKSVNMGPPTNDDEYSDYSGIIHPVRRSSGNEDDIDEDNPARFPMDDEDEEWPDEESEETDDDNSDDENLIRPLDEENAELEEEKIEPENDDEKKYVPEEESLDDKKDEEDIPKEVDEEDVKNGDENIPPEEDESGKGSIFDMAFFNLEKAKDYFRHLNKALFNVFRQTLDEALLLNGTYANTTKEEVDINGKKYIVTKSVIKRGDNNGVMYVEALSSKPKINNSEVMSDTQLKNVTHT